MAAATYTASEFYPLKANATGENIVRARYNHTATVSVSGSDVFLLVRVPNKAVITDGYISGGTAANSTATYKLGIIDPGGRTLIDPDTGVTASDGCIFSEWSCTTVGMARFGVNLAAVAGGPTAVVNSLPWRVSLSDDAAQQYVWVALTHISGSATLTASYNICVKYLANPGS